jgi:hypothetical protein
MKEIAGYLHSQDNMNNKKFLTGLKIAARKPKHVDSYNELLRYVTVLSHKNSDIFLLFRGQSKAYQTHGERQRPCLLPSFFRPETEGGYLGPKLKREREALLEKATAELLKEKFDDLFYNAENLKHYEELAWALLQHYQVCPTPLLDLTSSLHVACSIASYRWNKHKKQRGGEEAVVYLLGFSEMTPNISFSYSSGLQLIRLAGVLPENSFRPLYQEGYLVCEYPRSEIFKGDNDFAKRLIASFSFKPDASFWARDFAPLPEHLLFPAPKDDEMARLMDPIRAKCNGGAT